VSTGLPFAGVVGQDDAKLSLALAAAEPRLGGVLLRGEKGSAKTTLARGLAALLPGSAPFVELPLGATEDRVLGSIDAAHLLAHDKVRVRPGLLAAANGGVLYVDEVNLLADHLVDALLDAAVSGVGRIERDGVSHTFPARFVLIGSMNPEEGELRPQLLDRFGLAVEITAPTDPAVRAEVVARQLAVEHETEAAGLFADETTELRARLESHNRAVVPTTVVDLACRVAVEVGAEGLRADLMLVRAAAALAGWEGCGEATDDDLRRVAPMVLAHRRRRDPFDTPGMDDQELDDAFDQASDPSEDDGAPDDAEAGEDQVTDPGRPSTPPRAASNRRPAAPQAGRRSPVDDQRGGFVRAVPGGDPDGPIALAATAIAVAERRATEPDAALDPTDLHAAVRKGATANLVIIAVDTSSSMGASDRIAAAKGAVLGLLTDAYQQRDRVALVAFRGERAEVVLRPTGSVEVARSRLAELPVGGTTPLADALDTVRELADRADRGDDAAPTVVLVTDGRATSGGDDPMADAEAAADRLARLRAPTLVVDAEDGRARLGLAAELATRLGARRVELAGLGPASDRALVTAIRALRD
jgi:magnesium chelatase subunit D